MASETRLTRSSEFAAHDETLRHQVLLVMTVAVALTALAILWTAAIWPPSSGLEPLPLVGALAICVAATAAARTWMPQIATEMLVLSLAVTLAGVILGYGNGLAAAGFAVLVLAACAAGNWRHGLFGATVSTGAVLTVSRVVPEILTPALNVQALLLIWATLGIAWLGARRLQTAYAWAWGALCVFIVYTMRRSRRV